MSLRRAFVLVACLMPVAAGSAAAQWPAPQQNQAPAGAWPAPTAAPTMAPPSAPTMAPAAPQAGPPAGAWPAPGQPQAGFSPMPMQRDEPPPCVKEFIKLREATDERGKALQAASKRKVPPPVACKLFNDFVAAEAKLVKYANANVTACQIPPQAVDNMTKNHAKSSEMRTRVCEVAAAPPKPRGPSLSDALSAPVPNSDNVKTGRGTFDTLTGSPLGR